MISDITPEEHELSRQYFLITTAYDRFNEMRIQLRAVLEKV